MGSSIQRAGSKSEIQRGARIAALATSGGILSIFMSPYSSLGFRMDQLLIPALVALFLFLYGIPRKLALLLVLNISILLVIPLLLAQIRISLSGYSFSLSFLIRELQNILKMPIYLAYGYFAMRFLSEKALALLIRVLIVFAFTFTLLTVAQNYFGIPGYRELSYYYKIHPYASSMGRFPGIFTQPATAGMFCAVMSYVLILFKKEIPARYLFLVFLVGVFATSKVFVFSIPFFTFAYVLWRWFERKNPAVSMRKYSLSTSKILLALISLSFAVVTFFMFWEVIINSYNYLLSVINYDPLAGRGGNITMDSISTILNRFPLFGIGLVSADQFSHTAAVGLWDSLIYYDLYHYGLIGMIAKNVLVATVFLQSARSRTELVVFIVMLLNLFAIGLGIPVFGQERIADLMWIFIGFSWARKNIYSIK